jgi:hypothetical protein
MYLKPEHVPENGPAGSDPVKTTTLILGSSDTTLSAVMRAFIVFWDRAFRFSGLLILTENNLVYNFVYEHAKPPLTTPQYITRYKK